jgi:holo-[acyl-carrier protein] synthase
MIIGIGIDLVEMDRLENQKLIERVLSKKELKAFESITNDIKKKEFVAGRFASKEALFKAFSKGDLKANYQDFSILNNEDGKPYVLSKWIDETMTCHLSITHTTTHAMAMAVLEKKEF